MCTYYVLNTIEMLFHFYLHIKYVKYISIHWESQSSEKINGMFQVGVSIGARTGPKDHSLFIDKLYTASFLGISSRMMIKEEC